MELYAHPWPLGVELDKIVEPFHVKVCCGDIGIQSKKFFYENSGGRYGLDGGLLH